MLNIQAIKLQQFPWQCPDFGRARHSVGDVFGIRGGQRTASPTRILKLGHCHFRARIDKFATIGNSPIGAHKSSGKHAFASCFKPVGQARISGYLSSRSIRLLQCDHGRAMRAGDFPPDFMSWKFDVSAAVDTGNFYATVGIVRWC
jgi:hypothetical protein